MHPCGHELLFGSCLIDICMHCFTAPNCLFSGWCLHVFVCVLVRVMYCVGICVCVLINLRVVICDGVYCLVACNFVLIHYLSVVNSLF